MQKPTPLKIWSNQGHKNRPYVLKALGGGPDLVDDGPDEVRSEDGLVRRQRWGLVQGVAVELVVGGLVVVGLGAEDEPLDGDEHLKCTIQLPYRDEL